MASHFTVAAVQVVPVFLDLHVFKYINYGIDTILCRYLVD